MTTFAVSSAVISINIAYLLTWDWAIRLWRQTQSAGSRRTINSLYIVLGGFQIAQFYLAWFGWKEILPKVSINVGTSVLFPISLIVMLHLYLKRSPTTFRHIWVLLFASNTLIVLFIYAVRAGMVAQFPKELNPLWTHAAAFKIILGTILLFADMLVMVGIYHRLESLGKWGGLGNWHYFKIAPPIMTALVLDSFLYSVVISSCDGRSYWQVLVVQLITKIPAGALYAGILTLLFNRYDVEAVSEPAEPAESFLLKVAPSWLKRFIQTRLRRDYGLTNREKSITQFGMNEPSKDAALADARARAREFLRKEWSWLLEAHRDEWVAVGPAGLIANARSVELLEYELSRRDINENSYIVRQMGSESSADVPTIATTPDIAAAYSSPDSPDPVKRAESALMESWADLVAQKSGQWVAFDSNGLIADDKSYSNLMKTLKRLNCDDFVIRRVDILPAILSHSR